MGNLESGEYRLNSILENSRFITPEYQRYYSWEGKQWSDLWTDLNKKISSEGGKRPHYMGTIICEKKKNRNGTQEYELVDGQQRLATLTILLKCVMEKSENAEKREKIREKHLKRNGKKILELQKGELDDDKILDEIIEGNEKIETRAPSQRKLVEARSFFRQKLNDEDEETLESIVETIESLKFMVYSIEDDEKATLIFESINDRGKNLTNLDITKSFLIHQTYLEMKEGERRQKILKEIKNSFADIYTLLEKLKKRQNTGDIVGDLLQSYHYVSYMEDSSGSERKEIRKEYLQHLKKSLKDSEDVEKTSEYVKDFRNFLEIYKSLTEVERDNEWEKILYGEATYFIPLVVRARQEIGGEERFDEFLQVVEAATFRTHYREKRVDRGEETYFRLSHQLQNGEKSLEEVEEKIKETVRI